MGRKNRRGQYREWPEEAGHAFPAANAAPTVPQPPPAVKPFDRFAPLDSFPEACPILGPERLAWIVWGFVGLGVVVRTIRYLLNFPLWPDEAYLAHNYLDRGYLDLLQPLDYGQVAPLLHLWVQKTFVLVCGFSEHSLRLYAFLGSIAALFLFRHIAGRLLAGVAQAVAVGTFAVAYPLIRYSAEAKPYGSDVFTTLVLLALLVEWRWDGRRTRWLWALAAAMPLAVLLSYPAVFVVPVVSLAMMIELVRGGTVRQWAAWLGINSLAACALAILLFASARGQMAAAGPDMQNGWAKAFPPLHSAQQTAMFLVESHTGEAFAYPAGGARGASSLTTICCATALVLLLRARRFWLATVVVLPLALNFTAAAMHIYPYAGHVRVMLYTAPTICLMFGLGAAGILSWTRIRRWSPAVPVVAALALLAAAGGIASIRDCFKPYKETCWQRNRDFARWFWTDKALGAELTCTSTDFKQPLSSVPGGDDLASVYFCNQRIYSRRIARRQPPQLDRVSADCPLLCARFRPSTVTDDDEARFRAWLRTMEPRYRLVGRERYPLTFFVHEHELQYVDQVEVYELAPRAQETGKP